MSIIKTGVVLAAGAIQYDTTATTSALHRREVLIPLTPDGAAVRVASSGSAGGITDEALVTIRAAAVMTSSYVGSTAVDMSMFNWVYFLMTVNTTNAETATFKVQYSADNTTWTDYKLDSFGAASGGEVLATENSWTKQISCASSSTTWGETFSKKARYIRVAVKSDGTTAKIVIQAQRFNA